MSCRTDTNGDGDCGRRNCPDCNSYAWAAAVEAERLANQPVDEDAEVDAEVTVTAEITMPTVKVSVTAFNRAVEIEAPNDLDTVSAAVLRLWQATDDPKAQPVGASGFAMGEPGGSPPLEMTPRVLEPFYDRGVPRAA